MVDFKPQAPGHLIIADPHLCASNVPGVHAVGVPAANASNEIIVEDLSGFER